MPFLCALLFSSYTAFIGFTLGYLPDAPLFQFPNMQQEMTLCCAASSGESLVWRDLVPDSEIVTSVTCADSGERVGSAVPPNPTQHTLGHLDCPACEAARLHAIREPITGEGLFSSAAEHWIESRSLPGVSSRARFVAPRTLKDYEQYVSSLSKFFGNLRLKDIHLGHIREYQTQRSTGKLGPTIDELVAAHACYTRKPEAVVRQDVNVMRYLAYRASLQREISPNKINQELGVLVRILRRAGAWTAELEEWYEPLQREEHDLPRALSPVEQAKFLEIASSREEWQFTYWYSLLALHTTANNQELRRLRLGDYDPYSKVIYIRVSSSKNRYRTRTIPLDPEAAWAIERIKDRAAEMGASGPQHCLMPYGVCRNTYDPLQPMSNSGIKKPFDAIRKAAGVPSLRLHDLRHTAITRLAEAGTPIDVIMSMAGHISEQMRRHYTQISEQAKRRAMDAAHSGGFYFHSERAPAASVPKTARAEKRFRRGAFSS